MRKKQRINLGRVSGIVLFLLACLSIASIFPSSRQRNRRVKKGSRSAQLAGIELSEVNIEYQQEIAVARQNLESAFVTLFGLLPKKLPRFAPPEEAELTEVGQEDIVKGQRLEDARGLLKKRLFEFGSLTEYDVSRSKQVCRSKLIELERDNKNTG